MVDTLSERLAVEQQERAMRLEKARRAVEAEKLRECTFAPKLSHQQPPPAVGEGDGAGANGEKPLVIKGIARHMELKMMAKRKADEQAMREQKAFLTEPPSRMNPYTVPEPFKLNEYEGATERAERVRLEVERQRMEECTFAPQVKEESVATLLKGVGSGRKAGGYAAKHAEKAAK